MYDQITVTRTLMSVPADDALAVTRAIVTGDTLDTADVQPATLPVADLLDRQHSGGAYAPLFVPDTKGDIGYATSVYRAETIATGVAGARMPLAVEWWSFDFGDVVHAHAAIYRHTAQRRHLPIALTCSSNMAGTTSRPLDPYAKDGARRADRIEFADLFRTDYIFGDQAAPIPDTGLLKPTKSAGGAFAYTRVAVVSGPPLNSPAWRTAPVPRGTDLHADMDNPNGCVQAIYRMTRNI